jgi:hypothetical protein
MAKKNKIKNSFLDELKKVPIVIVACERAGISRNSVYRWRKEDKEFYIEMEQALSEGEDLVNDMTESQLITMIKEKNWPAMKFWLSKRNPKFKDKVEVTQKVGADEDLSPEQQEIVRNALKLGSIINTHETYEANNKEEKNKKDN